MRKFLFLILILTSFASFAEDVEVTLSGPLVRENVIDIDLTENNSGITQDNPCSKLNPGFDQCSVSGDLLTVTYPLVVVTNIQAGFMGTLTVDSEMDTQQYFHSFRVLENSQDIPSFVDFYSNETKSYQIEIKIKYKGPDAFQDPKGAIYFTLNAAVI